MESLVLEPTLKDIENEGVVESSKIEKEMHARTLDTIDKGIGAICQGFNEIAKGFNGIENMVLSAKNVRDASDSRSDDCGGLESNDESRKIEKEMHARTLDTIDKGIGAICQGFNEIAKGFNGIENMVLSAKNVRDASDSRSDDCGGLESNDENFKLSSKDVTISRKKRRNATSISNVHEIIPGSTFITNMEKPNSLEMVRIIVQGLMRDHVSKGNVLCMLDLCEHADEIIDLFKGSGLDNYTNHPLYLIAQNVKTEGNNLVHNDRLKTDEAKGAVFEKMGQLTETLFHLDPSLFVDNQLAQVKDISKRCLASTTSEGRKSSFYARLHGGTNYSPNPTTPQRQQQQHRSDNKTSYQGGFGGNHRHGDDRKRHSDGLDQRDGIDSDHRSGYDQYEFTSVHRGTNPSPNFTHQWQQQQRRVDIETINQGGYGRQRHDGGRDQRKGIGSDHRYEYNQRENSYHYIGGGEERGPNHLNSNYYDYRHDGESPSSQHRDGRNNQYRQR